MKQILGVMITDENISATIMLEDGKVVSKIVNEDAEHFTTVLDALKTGDNETAIKYLMGWTPAVEQTNGEVNVSNGVLFFQGVVVENALTKRIIRMVKEGFDVTALKAFMNNLMLNPSNTAINELYLFLEANNLAITDDGCFLAYKSVNANFESIHTNPDGSRVDNSVGSKPSMPRNMVDDNRDNTCSRGLHFASLDYCKNSYRGDKIVALKINPRDVVSIPSDYNNQKGRACEYEVVAEVTHYVRNEDRDVLSEKAVMYTGGGRLYHNAPLHTEIDAEALRATAKQQARDIKGRFTKTA